MAARRHWTTKQLLAEISRLLNALPWPGERRYSRAPGHHNSLVDKVRQAWADNRPVALLYVDIVSFQKLEQVFGRQACRQVLRWLPPAVTQVVSSYFPASAILEARIMGGDDYAIYYLPDTREDLHALYQLAQAIRYDLVDKARTTLSAGLKQEIDFHLGYALLQPDSGNHLESQMYLSLKEAMRVAKEKPDLEKLQLQAELRHLIRDKLLLPVYQPIVLLSTGQIFGFEALTRGPVGSTLHAPAILFPLAQETGLLYPLEQLAREQAIRYLPGLQPGQKLFLNIDPQVVNDPTFAGGNTRYLLATQGLSPTDVVFELTERNAIRDFYSFRKTLEHYRSQGYLVAVDDAGAGYSSLQTIAELQPDFIKMDISLVKGIHQSPLKRALMETFSMFAARINSRLITEGIENQYDLQVLLELGIALGQGFFLARPASPPPPVTPAALEVMHRCPARLPGRSTCHSPAQVTQICRPVKQVPPSITTREVATYLEQNPQAHSLVVVAGARPEGLVMRDKLYYHLASQYGVALYWERPVTHVMDSNALLVDETTPVEIVSQLAMNRRSDKLYDDLIVTRAGKYLGNVSVQALLDTITQVQIELARHANPLTGLPGNIRIEDEINQRLQDRVPFALIYADLDLFKAFNDHYGFERGDQAIRLTAQVLGETMATLETNGFIGHIGGDDFVIIVPPAAAHDLCQQAIAQFDRLAPSLYDPGDVTAGGISSHDRQGNIEWFPFISISLSVVNSTNHRYQTHLEMAEVAAELKQLAKGQAGSSYALDRRVYPLTRRR